MNTAPLTDYLTSEIPPMDLAMLLDEHLHDMVEWIAQSGEPITDDQRSTYYHLKQLRNLFVQLSNGTPPAVWLNRLEP
jgi:Lactococcus bacteriophage repressor